MSKEVAGSNGRIYLRNNDNTHLDGSIALEYVQGPNVDKPEGWEPAPEPEFDLSDGLQWEDVHALARPAMKVAGTAAAGAAITLGAAAMAPAASAAPAAAPPAASQIVEAPNTAVEAQLSKGKLQVLTSKAGQLPGAKTVTKACAKAKAKVAKLKSKDAKPKRIKKAKKVARAKCAPTSIGNQSGAEQLHPYLVNESGREIFAAKAGDVIHSGNTTITQAVEQHGNAWTYKDISHNGPKAGKEYLNVFGFRADGSPFSAGFSGSLIVPGSGGEIVDIVGLPSGGIQVTYANGQVSVMYA